MIYKVGMLCKHFKGKDLLEKNIYRIEQLGVKGTSIDTSLITYTGEGNLEEATDLVVYSNIYCDFFLLLTHFHRFVLSGSDHSTLRYF